MGVNDPWRWARKHTEVENMPKCPGCSLGWNDREKKKYGKIPVLMGPKSNPDVSIEDYRNFSKQKYNLS